MVYPLSLHSQEAKSMIVKRRETSSIGYQIVVTLLLRIGYDSEEIITHIGETSSQSVILRKQNSKQGNAYIDWCLYKYRHLVENVFTRLKHYRGIATRYDKLQQNYESTVALGCRMIRLSMNV